MPDSTLNSTNVKTQHELGSVRDGSAANETMTPSKNVVDPSKVVGRAPDAEAQKAGYGVREGQATAKKNAAEEKTINDANPLPAGGGDPLAVGRATATKNLKK